MAAIPTACSSADFASKPPTVLKNLYSNTPTTPYSTPTMVETGFGFEDETTSLLSHGREGVHYGSNPSNLVGARGCIATNGTENSHNESGDHLLSKSSQQSNISPIGLIRGNSIAGGSDRVSFRLHNIGSVARDHLALERTFLSYMRTSLAMASAGVALVQLFNTSNHSDSGSVQNFSRPLGASAIAMGLCVLAIGLIRFFKIQAALIKGYFPVTRLGVAFIAAALASLVTAVFSILLTGRMEIDEGGT